MVCNFYHGKHFRKRFRSYLEVKSECSERLEMPYFNFLQILEWQSWNRFLGRRGKALKNLSKSEFGQSKYFTVSWKTCLLRVVIVQKSRYLLFCKCLNREVEIIFWESNIKPWKWFVFKVCQGKHFRELFWNYYEVKKRMFWVFQNGIFNFFTSFLVTKLKPCSGKVRQCFGNFLCKFSFVWSSLEKGF